MMKADTSSITKTILSLERGINERWNKGDVDGQWRVVHVNWSFTRHPAAMQGLMS